MSKPFFHVGIVVDDIDEAVARYSELLRTSFAPIQNVNVPRLVDGDRTLPHFRLRLTYCTEGPPYIELLQAVGDGVYSRTNVGVHHVGMWEEACEHRIRELEQLGLQPEAVQYTDDGRIIVAYLKGGSFANVRVELVDEGRRPMMERWLEEGGEWVD